MFEHHSESLLSKRDFLVRQAKHVGLAGGFILGGWAIGISGYVLFEDMSFIDATLNAAMILGGMGPVSELHTTAGKLFASFYAIFSGVGFIGATGVIFAPLYHRFFHQFHLSLEEHRKAEATRKEVNI